MKQLTKYITERLKIKLTKIKTIADSFINIQMFIGKINLMKTVYHLIILRELIQKIKQYVMSNVLMKDSVTVSC